MKKVFSLTAILFVAIPYMAFAATVTSLKLEDIIAIIGPIVSVVIGILDVFALMGFFWGLAMYIWNIGKTNTDSHGTTTQKIEGKRVMLWGIVALFVLLSISGLLAILQNTFSLKGNPAIVPPSADSGPYFGNTNNTIPDPSSSWVQ